MASASTDHLDVIEPATEERLGQIADATDAEVDRAIDIANSVRVTWNDMDPRSRAVILHDIAAVIRRDKALYAECLTREEGKPFKEAVDEVSWCATAIDYYAELARHETGRIAGATVPGQFHFSIKEPLGHHRHRAAVQLSARAPVLGGGGGACRRQCGHRQAA